MQDLTYSICHDSKIEETRQMMDKRDFKIYWVAKLADGSCWMVQNLDYDIPESELPGVRRYDATTGLDPQTEPAKSQIGRWPENTLTGSDGIPRYYDPGYYYYANTSSWEACANVSDGLANANCANKGWKATGDAHFSVGNYYNWYAATKGSGTNSTTGEADKSICPAGWKLPKGNVDESGSFGTALPENGNQSGDDYSLAGVYKWTNNNDVNTGAPSLRVAPLYFVPSGYVHSGLLYSAGGSADYWSSTASSTVGFAYYLSFNSTRITPVYDSFVSHGFPVRCLVLGS